MKSKNIFFLWMLYQGRSVYNEPESIYILTMDNFLKKKIRQSVPDINIEGQLPDQ